MYYKEILAIPLCPSTHISLHDVIFCLSVFISCGPHLDWNSVWLCPLTSPFSTLVSHVRVNKFSSLTPHPCLPVSNLCSLLPKSLSLSRYLSFSLSHSLRDRNRSSGTVAVIVRISEHLVQFRVVNPEGWNLYWRVSCQVKSVLAKTSEELFSPK